MGIVFLAEQTAPVRRRVALKLIKLGMDTQEVVARFESERQALALMNHPSVAKVLDAGATTDGRPYFVMEYVPGIPVTEYCDKHKLTTRERLQLLMSVCHAVQHAHQKGIIHRDIKPSNVLVMLQDDRPLPKVIDFGVAKATDQRLTERTVFTEQGRLIGTPEYMSPEQAEMTPLDIDTRTDIYSLGVLLYELLVGVLPFEPETLRSAGYLKIQEIIREVEPPRPSTRLGTLGDASTAVSQRRRTDARALARLLRGDLDWITMKALEKDRTRRYASASELAADMDRYLTGKAVVARPPSVAYRFSKFVRRNRGFVAGAAALVATLVLGLTVSILFYAQASHQRDQTDRARRQLQYTNDQLRLIARSFAWRELTRAHFPEEESEALWGDLLSHLAKTTLARKQGKLRLPEVERMMEELVASPPPGRAIELRCLALFALQRRNEQGSFRWLTPECEYLEPGDRLQCVVAISRPSYCCIFQIIGPGRLEPVFPTRPGVAAPAVLMYAPDVSSDIWWTVPGSVERCTIVVLLFSAPCEPESCAHTLGQLGHPPGLRRWAWYEATAIGAHRDNDEYCRKIASIMDTACVYAYVLSLPVADGV